MTSATTRSGYETVRPKMRKSGREGERAKEQETLRPARVRDDAVGRDLQHDHAEREDRLQDEHAE